ncbi:histidine--tRNA ligase [Candidatus Roizmanbacteria bacterium RIFCSPLOWO2_01_FULL_37_13]|uniref:Histidine--tRNA ligase n=1 Tax=Candidatus Roizmanbacteria bacterium RIFCSPHIGHO2_02_FULL_38_11 TaxID=1802039 RepID=A0A1F7H1U2_9BACT|nr:MAG: histidine--tRNA ligase [Candidatus Roizmanbacteria bacterium RIFCSPHIGHO2_02_FULL_38_11]OGK35424.1 MAG: histidine--tRNA ligase [Candidatus Roizmanbacteria bacterium RIFCSPHIGHO2_12_FULL_37_9b]OGK42525.1 MAG: histidine--tRNA ligase [Candidatus Roizmanbacteria bacterium RIFCSPLOWO2_01_FULL_37_13]
MIRPQTLKGFRDFLPAEARKRQWLRNKLAEICESWGYDPIETPTLEYLELFAGQIGEDEKMFFKFKDQGGRDVALRYDQTVPSVRFVTQYQNLLTKPFKRYQIQTAFRSEKPQKGRYREFIQCDADIFGDPTPYADAETIALSLDIYRRLGFKKARVLINDRTLLKEIPYQALISIDKIKKIGEDGVILEMGKRGIGKDLASKYLKIVKSLKPNKTIDIILDYLKKSGFDESWFEFDPTIARSFSYSQGPIWEVVIPEYSAGSVLGGERYDGLFKSLFGIEMSGTGFGLGFDRTLEAAEQFGLIPVKSTASQVLVTVFSVVLFEKSINTAQFLRNKGIFAEIISNPEIKFDKQLRYADKKGIPYVVIIGPDEVKKNVLKLKNMKTSEQSELNQTELINKLKNSS